jgi:hypothetical protein
MIDNYAKPWKAKGDRLRAKDLFFFDSGNENSVNRALAYARKRTPDGKPIVVWRPLSTMPSGVRCVGHAPKEILDVRGTILAYECRNCNGERERNP